MNKEETYQRNRKSFQELVIKTKKEFLDGNYFGSVYYSSYAATFAWTHHPGSFFSGDLESTLISIGAKRVRSNKTINNEFLNDNRLKVLHVASEVYDTGGHSREIINWIENTKEHYNNLLVLTRAFNIGPYILASLKRRKINTVFINNGKNDIFDVASKLKNISRDWPDYIILHTHPDDVVPLLAYSSFEGPPILLFNHADHVFWLGSEISDAILNIRKEGLDLSNERRNTSSNFLLPLPLESKESIDHRNKDKAFMKNKKIILTMASDYKYTPLENYSFSNFFKKFLEKRKDVGLIAIGTYKNGNLSSLYNRFPDRVILVPPTPNIQEFLSVADLYIDSFPMSSLTSYLDVGMKGIPIVGLKNGVVPFLSAKDPAFDNIPFQVFFNSQDVLESELDYLLDNNEERTERGIQIRDRIIKNHCNTEWFDLANENLRRVRNHNISSTESAFFNKEAEYDSELAFFLKMANEKERFLFKTFEWVRGFSYLYLNSFIGKKVENFGHFITYAKKGDVDTK